MEEEPIEQEDKDLDSQISEHILPLRDRIVKIETIINYHDKEFQNVKGCISDLARTVDRNQVQILDKMEQYNKDNMDVLYSQYRESSVNNADIIKKIQSNKNTFDSYVAKWKAVSWAVWFTISVTLGAVAWGLTTAQDLGLFDIQKSTSVEILPK